MSRLSRWGSEFFVLDVIRFQHFPERIAKQVRILAIVKSEAHFVEIGREMLRADFTPCSYDAPLEQRKRGFHRICVNIASRIFFRVADRAMLSLLSLIQQSNGGLIFSAEGISC